MKPNLDKLENLSDDQLKKISHHVDTIGIRKAAAEASKDADRSIDKTCIQRLKERSIARRFLVESPDTSQAATDILRFAVTGKPDFSETTIKVLEETAFKLSLECVDAEEEKLKALNSITVMLARYRNASVRERMAKIQEAKRQLRREEFEWKTSLQTSSVSTRPNSTLDIRHSKLGSLPAVEESAQVAKALADIERRACALVAHPSASPELALPMNTGRQSGDPATDCDQTVSTVSSESVSPNPNTSPYLQEEKNPESPSTPNRAVAARDAGVPPTSGRSVQSNRFNAFFPLSFISKLGRYSPVPSKKLKNVIAYGSMTCNGSVFANQTLDQPSFFLRQRAEGRSGLQNKKREHRERSAGHEKRRQLRLRFTIAAPQFARRTSLGRENSTRVMLMNSALRALWALQHSGQGESLRFTERRHSASISLLPGAIC